MKRGNASKSNFIWGLFRLPDVLGSVIRSRAELFMKTLPYLSLLGLLFLASPLNAEEPKSILPTAATNNPTAEKAWKDFEKAASTPPVPPAAWRDRKPTAEEREKFQAMQREMASGLADKARDFYIQFPNHPKVPEARAKERMFLGITVQLGDTNQVARLEALEKAQLNDASISEDEKFELRAQSVQRAASKKRPEGMDAMMEEFEKGVRELQKEFPKRPEVYEMLLMVASNGQSDKARAIADEVIKNEDAPENLKSQAKGILKKMDALGKPLAIQFKAVDGREVDLAKMKGKVVLIDFWATWCGPCIAELPHVKEAYEKLHPKGFEIVGISFDQSKEKLTDFIKAEKMAWPQYFDGEGWKNKFGQEFGINSIPAMWLVDKKGILRDMNARADLEKKVEKYLAE